QIVALSRQFSVTAIDSELAGFEWIVDALLGTGATGAPRPPMDAAIRRMNASAAKRLAVDLPSGLDCDTGEPADPTFRADHPCSSPALAPPPPRRRAACGQFPGRVRPG